MDNNKYFGYPLENYSSESFYSISKNFEVPDNKNFYHYASVDAVRSMLQHKDQTYTMWASHLSFLNDSEEFENGERLMFRVLKNFIKNDLCGAHHEDNEIFRNIVETFINAAKSADKDISINDEIIFNRNIYILCFCMEKNSLNQWKYYGRESGIALEFNLRECDVSGVDCNDENNTICPQIYKVIYDDKEKRSIVENFISKKYQVFLRGSEDRERNLLRALANMYGICPLFKHKDFRDEKECRMIFRPQYSYSQKPQDVRRLVKYRKRGDILLPYMEIKLHLNSGHSIAAPLIKNIYIGPGENQDLLYMSIRHFALHMGVFDGYMKDDHDNIQEIVKRHIIKSNTPFRG